MENNKMNLFVTVNLEEVDKEFSEVCRLHREYLLAVERLERKLGYNVGLKIGQPK